jgi:hypothetical protein
MEEERLDIFSSLASGIAVTHMTDSHSARKLFHLLLIEDLIDKALTLHSVEFTFRIHCDDTAALLTAMLKSVKSIIGETCRILNSIDAYDSTLMVKLVIPVIVVTLTHFRSVYIRSPVRPGIVISVITFRQSCQLFATKIFHGIVEERLLKTLIHDVLEEVALETLCMTHLSKDLAIAAYDTLDGII